MISRREFIIYSAVALGTTAYGLGIVDDVFADTLQTKAGISDTKFSAKDSYGRRETFECAPAKVFPMGYFAQTVLYSINPNLIVGSTIPLTDKQRKIVVTDELFSAYGTDEFIKSDKAKKIKKLKPELLIDIGSKSKSSKAALELVGDKASAPSMFFSGEFEDLADTYRKLGDILADKKCLQLADYISGVVNIVLDRQPKLKRRPAKRIFIASGKTGLISSTYKYLQANIFDYLNVECLNHKLDEIVIDADNGEDGLVDLNALAIANPDLIVFKDITANVFVREGSPTNILWKNMSHIKENRVLFSPRTEFDWLGSPIVAQCLGILWFGSVLYPDVYDIDVAKYAQEFYNLFVYSDVSKKEIRKLLDESGGF